MQKFKPILFILLIVSFSCISRNKTNNEQVIDKNDFTYSKFTIHRGINISHWLSQNHNLAHKSDSIFTQSDIIFLAKQGFDHLRIPVDEEQLWETNHSKRFEAFQMLHETLKGCQKQGLKVILDLHIVRSHYFNNKKNKLWESVSEQQWFIQMWIELSKEFHTYNNSFLAYELLNEAVAEKSQDWNNLLSKTIQVIRVAEPKRTLVIGSNLWQSPGTFHELVIPKNDTNIILSFHFYTPMILTHYQAPWMDLARYSGSVNYPGQAVDKDELANYSKEIQTIVGKYNGYFTRDTLLNLIQEPIEYAKQLHLKLYCGEFGCLPTVHRSSRLQWYKDMRYILEQNNIAWANWDYKGGFAIFNQQTGAVDENLIKVLILGGT